MKWLAPVVLWCAAACGESVLVGTEIASDAGSALDCTSESIPAEPAPAVFELVVDTSGTMDDELPNARGTKWTVTRDALLDAVAGMPEQTSLGVVFFPDVPNDAPACFDRNGDVSVGVLGAAGSRQRQDIELAFEAQSPEGGAPTHDAYDFAFDQLRASAAPGRRFMLLLTDNYPTYELNCRDQDPVDADPLIRALGFARMTGVSTFVVGLPGPEFARPTLSRMAFAGGTAPANCSHMGPRYCHFDLTNARDFPSAIERTLTTITNTALNCSYALPEAAADAERVQVLLSADGAAPELLRRASPGPCAEGWQYSEDDASVVLCERTCSELQERNARIELRSSCETEEL